MIYKILGTLIIGAAAGLAFMILKDDINLPFGKPTAVAEKPCVQLTPAQQLNKLINDDFHQLALNQELPPEWNHIATVEYRLGSDLAKALLGKARPTFQRVKEGTAFLELEILDIPDEDNPGIIIQASLFDIKSKNKIFEIGRTYNMEDLNHQNPSPEENPTPTAKPTPSANPESAPAKTQE